MHSPAYPVSQIAPLPPSPVSIARREPRSPLRVDVARADDLPHEGASPKKRTPRNSKSGKSPKSPMKSPQSSPYAEQRFGEMLSSVDRRSSDASVRGGDRDAARGGGGVGGSSPDGDAGGRRLSAVDRVAQSAEDDAQLAGGVTGESQPQTVCQFPEGYHWACPYYSAGSWLSLSVTLAVML